MSVLAKAVLAAGTTVVLAAAPASAWDPPMTCVGTSGTIVVCTDPNGSVYYSDCVYLGGGSCQQVTVYGPYVDCGGRYGSICDVSIG